MITRVDDNVCRGPRPQAQDIATLKARFLQVVCLEGIGEGKEETAELAPVKVSWRPISALQIYFTGITVGYLEEIVETIRSADKPTFVHCEWGRDRTGLVIAAYRVIEGELTPEEAWAEALSFGYRNWLNFGLNRTWKKFCKAHA